MLVKILLFFIIIVIIFIVIKFFLSSDENNYEDNYLYTSRLKNIIDNDQEIKKIYIDDINIIYIKNDISDKCFLLIGTDSNYHEKINLIKFLYSYSSVIICDNVNDIKCAKIWKYITHKLEYDPEKIIIYSIGNYYQKILNNFIVKKT